MHTIRECIRRLLRESDGFSVHLTTLGGNDLCLNVIEAHDDCLEAVALGHPSNTAPRILVPWAAVACIVIEET